MLKGYFKPTPQKLLRMSLGLRAMIGTISGAAYFDGNKDAAFWFLVAGAFVQFLIDCQKEGDKPRKPKYVEKVLLLLICFSVFVFGCRKKQPNVYQQNAAQQVNQVLIDSIVSKVDRIQHNINRLESALERSANNQTSIINQYKNVYEAIQTGGNDDSIQLAILFRLLAENRIVAFPRN